MSERETAEAIEADAIAWVARLDRAGDEACLEAELAAWLGDDARRRGAYFRAQAAWRMLDRASVLRGSAQQASAEPASGDSYAEERDDGEFVEAVPFISRRRLLFGGLAAAGVAGLFVLGRSDWDMPVQRIETAIGEIRRVPLEDGSMAAVNTASRLAVRLQPDTRQVELAQGEAWFQVAHDAARPFVVEAGDVRVQAVGTAFSVRRTAAGADIQVTDGTVEVWSVAQPGRRRRVTAGARVSVLADAGPQASVEANAEIDRNLAWRSGQLIFDGDTLGSAAAEFNRYNRVQVRIEGASLSSERFVGRFRTNEPEAFARAAATIAGARMEQSSNEIRLSRR